MELYLPTIVASFVVTSVVAFVSYTSSNHVRSIPQFKGKPVDAQYFVSYVSRFSSSWCSELLELAAKRGLNPSDLPWIDDHVRSAYAHIAFANTKEDERFWKRVLWATFWPLAKQWSIKLFHVAFEFVPNWAMLRLLHELERQVDEGEGDDKIWVYLLAFGFSSIFGEVLRNHLLWIQWADIGIPLRGQLDTMIFEKAMRRKASKEPPQNTEDEDDTKRSSVVSRKPPDSKKQLQGPLTLVAIDVVGVSMFAANNHLIPSCILRFGISITFLWSLLGWQSLLVGLLLNVSFVPISSYFIRKNNTAKRNMTKARDDKVETIAEALSGIRQIKFAAQESKWEEKIDESRRRELNELWKFFTSYLQQMFCATAGPISLATGAFTTYAVLNSELTPSVAFTALGLFSRLEGIITMVPDLSSDLTDANLSSTRIEDFLHAPENGDNLTPSNIISLKNAIFTWPSDEQQRDEPGHFRLRDITANFPNGELSVVFGDTGSGKSLLLAALLGEVDLISGTITAIEKSSSPEIPANGEMRSAEWIIPSKVAYVSQIPWIENASIKTNILFGLPFNMQRYSQVIEACALRKDLDILEDGDETEIGAKGINLSGGQRWRLTFARALYSRAGVLILDDIFAALDAHVGREIFEKGLTGELASGRTRILVTHHVKLCLPKASFLMHIADGTVEYAGLVDELRKQDKLPINLNDAKTSPKLAESDSDETLKNIGLGSKQSKVGRPKAQWKPKRLVQKETREKGCVKRRVYSGYFISVGNKKFWVICIIGFLGKQLLILSRSWWLKIWTSKNQNRVYSESHLEIIDSSNPKSTWYYLGIYLMLSLVSSLIGALPSLLLMCGAVKASRDLFRKMTFRVLRMPLRWIDTVPQGRIINRFTVDFATLDLTLPKDFSAMMTGIFQVSMVVVSG